MLYGKMQFLLVVIIGSQTFFLPYPALNKPTRLKVSQLETWLIEKEMPISRLN